MRSLLDVLLGGLFRRILISAVLNPKKSKSFMLLTHFLRCTILSTPGAVLHDAYYMTTLTKNQHGMYMQSSADCKRHFFLFQLCLLLLKVWSVTQSFGYLFTMEFSGLFWFWAPNSVEIFGLTQANFGADSANFLHLTQIFGIFKQKTAKFVLYQQKYWPNSAKFWSNSTKIFI